MQVAVGVVVAIRFVVSAISQPPSAAVGSLPRALLAHSTLHGVLRAATTTVGGTSHVNNEVRLLRVVVDVLAHSVVHEGPVVLVAWRPDLETIRARIFFSALPDPETVADLDQLTSRVTLHRDVCDLAVACAALPTALSCKNKFGKTSIKQRCTLRNYKLHLTNSPCSYAHGVVLVDFWHK